MPYARKQKGMEMSETPCSGRRVLVTDRTENSTTDPEQEVERSTKYCEFCEVVVFIVSNLTLKCLTGGILMYGLYSEGNTRFPLRKRIEKQYYVFTNCFLRFLPMERTVSK